MTGLNQSMRIFPVPQIASQPQAKNELKNVTNQQRALLEAEASLHASITFTGRLTTGAGHNGCEVEQNQTAIQPHTAFLLNIHFKPKHTYSMGCCHSITHFHSTVCSHSQWGHFTSRKMLI